MSAPGPSKSGGSSKQRHHTYSRGGGGGGRGRGGSGGRGRGRGGKPAPGGARGPTFTAEDGRVVNPLGRYREGIALIGLTAPGISVTTVQFKERSAERELIEYLETIADEMEESVEKPEEPKVNDDDLDLEAQLKEELEGLSGAAKVKSTRFRLCQHDTPCVIYINVLDPLDPVNLVYRILEKVESSGQSPFKYVKRLVPISAVGAPATLKQIGDVSKPLVEAKFATPDNRALKFAIQTNSRNSNKLERLELIKRVADEVVALPPGHTVDLSKADRTILVEVDKNSFGMSVVEHYDRFKKFNPSQIAEALAKARAGGETEGAAASSEPVAASGGVHANRVARAAALSAAVGLGGGEKRKAEDAQEDVEMGDASVEVAAGEGQASKVQRTE